MLLITKHHFSSRIAERLWHDKLILLDKGHQRLILLKTGLSLYKKLVTQQGLEVKTQDTKERESSFLYDSFHRKVFKSLRGPPAPPLLYIGRVQVGPQGQPIGSVATVPVEVDEIARTVWGKV